MSVSSELARKLSIDALIARLREFMPSTGTTEVYERANDLLSKDAFCDEFETTPDKAYRDSAMQTRALYCATYESMLQKSPFFQVNIL